jgi:hypothetical protein
VLSICEEPQQPQPRAFRATHQIRTPDGHEPTTRREHQSQAGFMLLIINRIYHYRGRIRTTNALTSSHAPAAVTPWAKR